MSTKKPLIQCKDCRFWDQNDGRHGYCRAHPPTVYLDHNGEFGSSYPQVDEDDGCGEGQY